jgi:hypothetical protein
MMRISMIIVAALALATSAHAGELHSTTQRDAPTVTFRDSGGNTTGSASTYGNETQFFDARGNHVGTSTNNGSRK